MKTYEGVELQLHGFLNTALDVSSWSVSCPGRFTPGEIFQFGVYTFMK